jgi:uncharacterized protein YdeI (YjbR/CyaY-like superfamily)
MNNEILFSTRKEFRNWLIKNARSGSGIWLVIGKTDKLKTVTAAEALEEALCFGWIDGQIKSVNETIYIKYFAPRRKESQWSEKNKKAVPELCKKGLMTDLGMEAINNAKLNGKWNSEIAKVNIEERIKEIEYLLMNNKLAKENFSKAPLSFRKQIVDFYFNAKLEETRNKRLVKILHVLEENKKQILY